MSSTDFSAKTRHAGRVGARLGLVALLALLIEAAAPARAASDYPDKPVHIVLPYGPGGVSDVELRIIAQGLTEVAKQQFLIDNRPGAGGAVAGSTVLNAAPDGYTLLMLGNNNPITETLFKSVPFHAATDFEPISMLAYFDMLIVSKYGSPLKSIKDIIAAAKAHPGRLNFGAIGTGSTGDLSAELFKSMAGVNVAIVPYRTTPEMITALVRGDIDIAFEAYTGMKGAIAGKLVMAVATSGASRSPVLPNVPTVAESGLPNYIVRSWNALGAPAHTPASVITVLNDEVRQAVAKPEVKEKLLQFGMEAQSSTPEDVTARINDDLKKWSAVIKEAGIPKQ